MLSACAALPQPAECGVGTPGPRIWLAERSWHTEIGVEVGDLGGGLVLLAREFPGAELLMFGFGKRHFLLAPEPGLAEFLAGPFPGEAALEVTGMLAPPFGALSLSVTPAGLAGLMAALEASFAPGPALIEARQRPARRYYVAARGYSLAYTCNTWTAELLGAAGLPVGATGVVFTRGVMAQALPLACRPRVARGLVI